ncbi:hypothetical protein BDW59DRAFT_119203 [Aspergillus cavernicola]|uniref:Peroxin 20 n=1 Tax=Aspergillus cavernicola TaxID=176166 RepID=A0ABR4HZ32_9EURO
MGDALCGPSNALQNFQKHTSVDRTLQQDRLISRQSPSQGFRSQNHNEGVLDPEFTAFESNNLVGAPIPDIHGGHFIAPAPHMPMSHPAEAPNWASDFQNLHISGPAQPVHHHPGPSVAASQSSWHNEFLRQHQQPTPVQQDQPFNTRFQSSFGHSHTMHATPMGTFAPAQETTANQSLAVEAFDESAFEAAFEQAKADMTSHLDTSVAEAQASDLGLELDDKDLSEETTTPQIATETIRIGSDTIPQVNKDDPLTAVNDADELARTAGQLLNSVSHETNQKFRESNFLALMRRIRDREVQVEGDKFRETTQSLHPGGKYYPEGKLPQEDEGKQSWGQINQDDDVHVMSNENNIIPERSAATSDATPITPIADSTRNPGPADYNSLYASWNHGDRWA